MLDGPLVSVCAADYRAAPFGSWSVNVHLRTRNLGFLSRLRGGAAARRRDRRRCSGGALLAEETRSSLSFSRDRILPEEGRHRADRSRARRLLRQAVDQVRAPARDLLGLRAVRPAVLPQVDAALAQRQ